MNERELSQRLDELATMLEEGYDRDDIIAKLRKLSNESYAPGNSTTWEAIKPKKQGGFISKTGKNLPF